MTNNPPKKDYSVCLMTYAEKLVTVSAETPEQAKQIAEASKENNFVLCKHCSEHFELTNPIGTAIEVEDQ